MSFVRYNPDTDEVPEKTGGALAAKVFKDRTHVEVQLGKFQGKVLPSGDMMVSTIAKVLGNDGTPINGAPWADFTLTLPFKNPSREDHEVSDKDRGRRYGDCYKLYRTVCEDAQMKYRWDKSMTSFVDKDGDPVDEKKARAHNKECEVAGANFVADIFNASLSENGEDILGSGEFGAGSLVDVEGATGATFFTKVYHSGETYTTKRGEVRQKSPRIYYVSKTAPEESDVMYEYSDLFEAA